MSFFFVSSRRRHTRFSRDWSSDVCSSDLNPAKRIMYLNYALQNQANLNTVAFRNLLDVPVSEVLKEGNSSDLRRALEVTTNFNLSLPGEHLGRVAKSTQNEGILNLTIKALNIADKPLSQYYLPIVEN